MQKEWKLYKRLMPRPSSNQGASSGWRNACFFSANNLERILDILLKESIVHPLHEFSIEGHPNNTTLEQLNVLYEYGFRRLSYGVQDNDPEVQRVINRIQPFENLLRATQNARDAGFTSINFDLIYELPLQTANSIEETINKITELKPDKIAFYSYAYVPWKVAYNETGLLLGLGVSAISDIGTAYAHKTLHNYYMNEIEPSKFKVTSIENIETAWFVSYLIHHIYIMN